jgi:2-oxo-hept-3-ene-1,7-dioate hydratase
MGKDIDNPDATIDDILLATDFIAPALEIIDHHIDPIDSLADAVADNSGFAAAVLADRRFRPDQIETNWVGAVLSRNGVIQDTGVSAISMGHPAACVAWLAGKLAKHGKRLRAGDIVLSGAFTKAIDLSAGDEIDANFGPYGRIRLSMAAHKLTPSR